MLLENQHPLNKSIMVGVVGVANAGKSSLINHYLGFDLSPVTPKPQTTRNRIQCVMNVDHTEVVLVDTPGLHQSSKEINVRMNYQAQEMLAENDQNMLLVDLGRRLEEQLIEVSKALHGLEDFIHFVVFTKADRVPVSKQETLAQDYFQRLKPIFPQIQKYFIVSALKDEGTSELIMHLVDQARPGPHLFPHGDASNKNERFFAAEYIREQAFMLLKEEMPYEIAVIMENFTSKQGPKGEEHHISAAILVGRLSQRAIVIGKGGAMIREIGIRSRKKIEAMMGATVHLNLHVKLAERWQKNNFILEELGLPRAPQSNRVWRASECNQ
jgi:GTP-binding protein Era